MKLTRIILVLTVALAVGALWGVSLAQDEPPEGVGGTELPVYGFEPPPAQEDIPDLTSLLTYVAGGGGIGIVISFLAENAQWFQKLTSNSKKWVIFGVCLGLPVIATLLLQFVPASVWEALTPYWFSIASGLTAWGGSQITHLWHKDKQAAITANGG